MAWAKLLGKIIQPAQQNQQNSKFLWCFFPLLQPCVRMKLWSLSCWPQLIVPQVPGQMRLIRTFPWQLLNGAPGSQSVFVGKSEMPGYRLLPSLLLLMETKPSKGTKPAEREKQTQRRKCLVMFKPLVLSSHGSNGNTALVCRRKKKIPDSA